MGVRLRLQDYLELFEDVQFEAEEVVIVDFEELLYRLCRYCAHLLILIWELLADELENIEPVIEMRVSLE